MTDCSLGRDLEKGSHSLIKVQFQNLPGGPLKSVLKPARIAGILAEI
jgi:hypothetical protein